MKKLLILVLSLLMLSLTACSTKIDVTDIANNLDDNTKIENKTVFELLNLSDSIEFSDKIKGVDFLINDKDLVNRFSNNDFYIRYGNYGVVSLEDRKKVYNNTILEWSSDEKNNVIKNIMTFENYFSDNNIELPNKIYLFKTKDSLEYGDFFIRENAIFIPESLVNGYKEDLKDTIVKSLFYMIMDEDESKYEKLCNSIGFIKTSELLYPKEYIDNKFTNNNAYKIDYYIIGSYKDKEFKFMPISYFNEKYTGDKNQIDKSIINKYIAVESEDGVLKPIYLDEEYNVSDDGKLLEINLNQLSNYYTKVSNNSSILSHPKEILADDFSIMVLGKKTNNESTLNRLLEILK